MHKVCALFDMKRERGCNVNEDLLGERELFTAREQALFLFFFFLIYAEIIKIIKKAMQHENLLSVLCAHLFMFLYLSVSPRFLMKTRNIFHFYKLMGIYIYILISYTLKIFYTYNTINFFNLMHKNLQKYPSKLIITHFLILC